MANKILDFFTYDHLPQPQQEVARHFSELAVILDINLLDSAEKSAGLRKLLEAKDCMVRASLEP